MVRRKIKRTVKFASVIIILVVLAFLFYGITNVVSISEEASILINNYGASALFLVSIFLDLIPQVISPIIILGVGLLAGINIYYAILATVLGSIIGSSLDIFEPGQTPAVVIKDRESNDVKSLTLNPPNESGLPLTVEELVYYSSHLYTYDSFNHQIFYSISNTLCMFHLNNQHFQMDNYHT